MDVLLIFYDVYWCIWDASGAYKSNIVICGIWQGFIDVYMAIWLHFGDLLLCFGAL